MATTDNIIKLQSSDILSESMEKINHNFDVIVSLSGINNFSLSKYKKELEDLIKSLQSNVTGDNAALESRIATLETDIENIQAYIEKLNISGGTGGSSVTSFVFIEDTYGFDFSSYTPIGGSYTNPYPETLTITDSENNKHTYTWKDSPTNITQDTTVWMSRATFIEGEDKPLLTWTACAKMSDSYNSNVEWCTTYFDDDNFQAIKKIVESDEFNFGKFLNMVRNDLSYYGLNSESTYSEIETAAENEWRKQINEKLKDDNSYTGSYPEFSDNPSSKVYYMATATRSGSSWKNWTMVKIADEGGGSGEAESIFYSYVFTKDNGGHDLSNITPKGGTYNTPQPDEITYTWEDDNPGTVTYEFADSPTGVTSNTTVWMTKGKFSSINGNLGWTALQKMADSADFNVEWCETELTSEQFNKVKEIITGSDSAFNFGKYLQSCNDNETDAEKEWRTDLENAITKGIKLSALYYNSHYGITVTNDSTLGPVTDVSEIHFTDTPSKTYYMATASRKNGKWDNWTFTDVKGEQGTSTLYSYVFTTDNLGKDLSVLTVSGGKYSNPIPDPNYYDWEEDSEGSESDSGYVKYVWTDTPENVTAGTTVWMTKGTVMSTDPEKIEWSKPTKMSDSTSFNVEWCISEMTNDEYDKVRVSLVNCDKPEYNFGYCRLLAVQEGKSDDVDIENRAEEIWRKAMNDNFEITFTDYPNGKAYFMATTEYKNGTWSNWTLADVKGEKGENGDPGTSINFKGTIKYEGYYSESTTYSGKIYSSDNSSKVVKELFDPAKNTYTKGDFVVIFDEPKSDSEIDEFYEGDTSNGNAIYLYIYDGTEWKDANNENCKTVSDIALTDGYSLRCPNYHVICWDGDNWIDFGTIGGKDGKDGVDGKSVYLRYGIEGEEKSYKPYYDDKEVKCNIQIVDIETESVIPTHIGTLIVSLNDVLEKYNINESDLLNNPANYTWTEFKGQDGFGYEYIFTATSDFKAPDIPNVGNSFINDDNTLYNQYDKEKPNYWDECFNDTDFVPHKTQDSNGNYHYWYDDMPSISDTNRYIWMCYRKKKNGSWIGFIGASGKTKPGEGSAKLWGTFSDERLFAYSYCVVRSPYKHDIASLDVEGGDYINPVPISNIKTWTDEHPETCTYVWTDTAENVSEDATVWMVKSEFKSSEYLNDSTNNPIHEWSKPVLMSDSTNFNVEWCETDLNDTQFEELKNKITSDDFNFGVYIQKVRNNPSNYDLSDETVASDSDYEEEYPLIEAAAEKAWRKDVLNIKDTGTPSFTDTPSVAYYMATATRSNGVWSNWTIVRVKGEKGEDGTSINFKGAVKYEGYYSETKYSGETYESDMSFKVVTELFKDTSYSKGDFAVIFNQPHTGTTDKRYTGDSTGSIHLFIFDNDNSKWVNANSSNCSSLDIEISSGYTLSCPNGHMICWDGDNWIDLGRITGTSGNSVYIKYAKKENGEYEFVQPEDIPEYIGIYVGQQEPDDIDDYTWTPFKGEDSFGYEYIYTATSTFTAPPVPVINSKNSSNYEDNDYIPVTGNNTAGSTDNTSGYIWYDNPPSLNGNNRYVWMCWRKRTNGSWTTGFIGASGKTKPGEGSAILWGTWSDEVLTSYAFASVRDTSIDLSNYSIVGGDYKKPIPHPTTIEETDSSSDSENIAVIWTDQPKRDTTDTIVWMTQTTFKASEYTKDNNGGEQDTHKWSKPILMTDSSSMNVEWCQIDMTNEQFNKLKEIVTSNDFNFGTYLDNVRKKYESGTSYSIIEEEAEKQWRADIITKIRSQKYNSSFTDVITALGENSLFSDNPDKAYFMATANQSNNVWSNWTLVDVAGEDGESIYYSYVFTTDKYNKMSSSASVSGGKYSAAKPNDTTIDGITYTWTDSPENVTSGTTVWMCKGKCSSKNPDSVEWGRPVPMADSTSFNVEWCTTNITDSTTISNIKNSLKQPEYNFGYCRLLAVQEGESDDDDIENRAEEIWRNEVKQLEGNPEFTDNPDKAYFMATTSYSNGKWSDWDFVKVAGEDGAAGAAGEAAVQYTLLPTPSSIYFTRKASDNTQFNEDTIDLYVNYSKIIGNNITTYDGRLAKNTLKKGTNVNKESTQGVILTGDADYNMFYRYQNADGTWPKSTLPGHANDDQWNWVRDLYKNTDDDSEFNDDLSCILQINSSTTYIAVEYCLSSAIGWAYISDDNIIARVTIPIQKESKIGLTGSVIRMRGIWDSSKTYVNNSDYRDVVMYKGASDTDYKYYIVKENQTEVQGAGKKPSNSSTYWTTFTEYENVATNVLLANKGYIDILGASSMFIGATEDSVRNTDGTISNSTANYGWSISKGRIYNTKTGLELTADGYIKDPNGLHILVGNEDSESDSDGDYDTLQNKLKSTGIDITNKKITLTANQLECQNNNGNRTMWLDSEGNLIVAGNYYTQIQTIDTTQNSYLLIDPVYEASDTSNLKVTYPIGLGKKTISETSDIISSSDERYYYLDVLRCGNVITLNNSGFDRNIVLPYYISYNDYSRTCTKYSTGSIHYITTDELNQLIGKRIVIILNGSGTDNNKALYYGPAMKSGGNMDYDNVINGNNLIMYDEVTDTSKNNDIIGGWQGILLYQSGVYVLEFSYGTYNDGYYNNENKGSLYNGCMCYYWKCSHMSLPNIGWEMTNYIDINEYNVYN